RGEARLDGPLRARGARPLPAEPRQPRARLAGARGQHAAHAEPRGQAPRDLRGKHRGCAGGHVRAPGGRGADARAHLRSPRDAGLRPPAEPARPAAGGLRFMPEVSIVIRCRDEARHLGPVLEAVLGQEGAPAAEVVALDSGSHDGTLALLARYPVRVEHLEHFSYGAALNRGAALAQGALLVYLSAHCRPMSLAVWRARFYAHGLAAEYARRRRGIELPWGEPRDGAARAFARLVGTLARRGEVRALAHLPSYALARTVWLARGARDGSRRYGAAAPRSRARPAPPGCASRSPSTGARSTRARSTPRRGGATGAGSTSAWTWRRGAGGTSRSPSRPMPRGPARSPARPAGRTSAWSARVGARGRPPAPARRASWSC